MFVSIELVFKPPEKVSKAVAVSNVVFCKYFAFACDSVNPDDTGLKNALSYVIPLKYGEGGGNEDIFYLYYIQIENILIKFYK